MLQDDIDVVSPDGEVMVSLTYIGEGCRGDYDSTNPNDTPLCRFDLYRKFHQADAADKITTLCETDAYEEGDWMAVRDGSYCTQLDANASVELLTTAARFILSRVVDGLRNFNREKRTYEKLSWVGLMDGEVVMF